MSKKKLLEGKTKKLYETDVENELVLEFKNDFPLGKKDQKLNIREKGTINSQISAFLFKFIDSYHIPNHFLRELSKKELVVKRLEMIPLQIMARNIATGSLVRHYGLEKGKELDCPVIEFYLKNDKGDETLINRDHIVSFGHSSSEELKEMHRMISKMNVVLRDFFRRRHLKLADFTVEFGRLNNRIVVGDEISLDTITLLDLDTEKIVEKESMGKDQDTIAAMYKHLSAKILG